MKNPILSIFCIICALSLALSTNAHANIYSQFGSVVTGNWNWGTSANDADSRHDFTLPGSIELTIIPDGSVQGQPSQFFRAFTPTTLPDDNLDDGYAKIPLGFSYTYNGMQFDSVYVSINGFVTFGDITSSGKTPPPSNIATTKYCEGLFASGLGYPDNVIAPYWGDHKYWANNTANLQAQRTPSEIGYATIDSNVLFTNANAPIPLKACIIQWKNLNINYMRVIPQGDGSEITEYYPGNVASFQLIIFEGEDPIIASQGSVEFRYGLCGPTVQFPSAAVPALGWNKASVGCKGKLEMSYQTSDFINALYHGFGDPINFPNDATRQRTYKTTNRQWPVSGDPSRAIKLIAVGSTMGDDSWGDGDADMSRVAGGRHSQYGATETNKFVTINDVVTIMRSVATGQKLDSIYRLAAFHADVHHDGRYYYFGNGMSALYRADRSTNYNIILRNSDIPALEAEARFSTDTFWLRKIGNLVNGYGFLEKYGKNDHYVYIDFRNSGISGLDPNNTIRKFKIIDPGNNDGLADFDYQVRLCLTDEASDADRELMRTITEDNMKRLDVITFKLKKNFDKRDSTINQTLDLPYIDNMETQMFWEATEWDASFILAYLGGEIGKLPWIWNNVEHDNKEKLTAPWKIADNISFDKVEYNDNTVVIPVYYNGVAESNQSVAFKYNANILDIKPTNANAVVNYDNANKTAVIISDGYFGGNTPVAYITIANDVNNFEASDVRFCGEYTDNVSYKLSNSSANNSNILGQCSPNPATNYTEFNVNIPENGNYTIYINDVNGNVVKTISNGMLNAGSYSFSWNATNLSGDPVANGTYFYTLEGDNTHITKQLVIAK